VAVVNQRNRPGNVVEFDGLKRLVQMSAANVDGRLLMTQRAGPVGRIQLAPDERPGLAEVAPVRGGGGAAAMAASPSARAASVKRRIVISNFERKLPEGILEHFQK